MKSLLRYLSTEYADGANGQKLYIGDICFCLNNIHHRYRITSIKNSSSIYVLPVESTLNSEGTWEPIKDDFNHESLASGFYK